jgi:hypothetical protein
MPVKQLSDGNTDGVVLGQSATDLVGFYGATPAVRLTTVCTAVDTTAITLAFTTTVTGTFGFVTSAQGTQVLADVADLATRHVTLCNSFNTLRAQLVALGFVKGA